MRWVKIIAINLALTVVLVTLVEGGAGWTLFLKTTARWSRIQERLHTEFDEQIGWINSPSVRVDDIYGPGRDLTTNSQRLRSRRELSVQVPEGKVRVVCSGDSFTLGYGVDDEHAWCRLLELLDDRLETANLGQGGYGVDQAYMWYQRNKMKLEHDALIFAFITEDFGRTTRDDFYGYDRPRLAIRDGELVPQNLPLSKRSFPQRLFENVAGDLGRLRIGVFVRALSARLGFGPPSSSNRQETREMVSLLFADLARVQKASGRRFVLLYLPTLADFSEPGRSDDWRGFVAAEAQENGYFLIDFVQTMLTTPVKEAHGWFQGPPNWHLTDAGNEAVAREVLRRLDELGPALQDRQPRLVE